MSLSPKARKVIWKMNTVNRQKAMNLIGLAMRAGKLITGEADHC